jgi:hypothetical protein
MYPLLRAQHDYLLRERCDGNGLVVIAHPWESGQDNSPAWDRELAAVPLPDRPDGPLAGHRRHDLDHVAAAERPTGADYARYIAIAEAYRDHGYRDADALPTHPFVVVDPLFNALLAWAEEALARIADALGEPSEPHRRRAGQIRDALVARCYDPAAGTFRALDRRGAPIPECTVSGLTPLVLDLPDDVVDALVDGISGPRSTPPATGAGRRGSTQAGSCSAAWNATAGTPRPPRCGPPCSRPCGTRGSASTSTRTAVWAGGSATSAGRRP